MRLSKIVVPMLLAAGAYSFTILYDEGMVGQTKKPLRAPLFAVKGCFCHGDSANQRTRVWISGPDSVRAGAEAVFRINVARDSNIAAGFNVAAFFGNLGVRDTLGTQLMRVDPNNPIDSLELTHVDRKLANGRDTISWQFLYRAPLTAGLIDTLYAVGNSVDTSQDPAGDFWNYAPNFLVRVRSASNVASEQLANAFRLEQNYPNPFNPSTTIRYTIPVEAHVHLTIVDIAGREVSTLVDAVQRSGSHEAKLSISEVSGRESKQSQLASGIYFYRLVVVPSNTGVQSLVAAKKMMLCK